MLRGVIFDLDGTLVNTLPDLCGACNEALERYALPTWPEDEYRRMVGNGARKLCERASGLGEDEIDDFCEYYKQCYVRRDHRSSVPYAGMVELLSQLRAREIKLAVVTNKPQPWCETLLDRLFSNHIFDTISGQTSGSRCKPDPETTKTVLEHWGFPTESVVFVGDSNVDVLTAHAAGLKCLGAGWGFRGAQELSDSGADEVLATVEQLKDYLFNFNDSRGR